VEEETETEEETLEEHNVAPEEDGVTLEEIVVCSAILNDYYDVTTCYHKD
jgi:hypothetical protein